MLTCKQTHVSTLFTLKYLKNKLHTNNVTRGFLSCKEEPPADGTIVILYTTGGRGGEENIGTVLKLLILN